ncbi:MAG: hypothetical protein M3220_20895, partial [Chloroflexota bacterium]|nr:hypothetical protein [Chloroflexota bacterium]
MTKKMIRLLGACLGLLLLVGLAVQGFTGVAYAQGEQEEDIFAVTEEEEAGAEEADGTPLSELVENPEQFEDEEVTLIDTVGATFGRRAFALGEEDQEVLIFTEDPQGFARDVVQTGATVRVVGEAGIFDRATFEEEF